MFCFLYQSLSTSKPQFCYLPFVSLLNIIPINTVIVLYIFYMCLTSSNTGATGWICFCAYNTSYATSSSTKPQIKFAVPHSHASKLIMRLWLLPPTQSKSTCCPNEGLLLSLCLSQSAKGAKIFSTAVAATGAGQQIAKDVEEKMKLHTHSYCCLDYAQIYDVVRYRMHRMKKKIKDELDSRNTIQEYICPNCGRRYSAFDALQLVSLTDEYFHCENCNGELVAESDKLAAEEMGDGDDNARKRRREKLKDMLQKMEEQLKPLAVQIARVKDLPVPEFGSLQAWEARANAAARANGDANALDPAKSSQGQGYSGTPMPFLGETKVEVALSGVEVKGEDDESDKKTVLMKVIPPWMIKEGMSLTKEQRGDTVNVDKSSELGDDKKSKDTKEDEKSIQDEYLKAYYEAILKRQKEQEEALRMQQEIDRAQMPDHDGVSETERQVGKKAKRGVYEDDNVEWEDAPPAVVSGSDEKYILADLNMEATASGDEDDDIDWEEG